MINFHVEGSHDSEKGSGARVRKCGKRYREQRNCHVQEVRDRCKNCFGHHEAKWKIANSRGADCYYNRLSARQWGEGLAAQPGEVRLWAHASGRVRLWVHASGKVRLWAHASGKVRLWAHAAGKVRLWAHAAAWIRRLHKAYYTFTDWALNLVRDTRNYTGFEDCAMFASQVITRKCVHFLDGEYTTLQRCNQEFCSTFTLLASWIMF